MKTTPVPAALVLGLALLPGTLAAQTASGPAVGNKAAVLKVAVATGEDAGKEVDLAARRKDAPTLYVFVQADKWDRPIARFLRALDQELAKGRDDVHIVAVWLTDDVDKAKEYLPKAQQSLQLTQTTFTVHPGDKNGPKGWDINVDAHATAVVVEGGKVTASFGYQSVNETEAPAVLKKLTPKKG